MEWSEYRERIESAGYRYDVPALWADAADFETYLDDLLAPFDPVDIDQVAGIDALGFVPGGVLARELDAGFVAVRKGGKLPIPDEHRVAESFVDYTDQPKRLEVDVRMVPDGSRVLVVDDWTETATQVGIAIELLEAAGAEIVGIAVLGAEANERPLELDDGYGIHSLRPWKSPDVPQPQREQDGQ
jgi:adenine phosphoribosyltransferase